MSIDLSTLVRRSADQVSCNLNDEVVVLNLKTSLYYGLNEVGAYVWEALSEPKSVGDICQIVMQRFEVSEECCKTDIQDLLGKLGEAGLVQFET